MIKAFLVIILVILIVSGHSKLGAFYADPTYITTAILKCLSSQGISHIMKTFEDIDN
jgi:hypothetical protein